MTFAEYEAEVPKTAAYANYGSNIEYPTLGLCGEAGEVANQIKKVSRDDGGIVTEDRLEKLQDELGDVLWYITALAHELGITLDQIADYNITKLRERHLKASA